MVLKKEVIIERLTKLIETLAVLRRHQEVKWEKYEKDIELQWIVERGFILAAEMKLNELEKALESLELLEDYDNQTIEGVSVFEVVSDTRRWEHILENLEKERLKLQRIKELAKSRPGV